MYMEKKVRELVDKGIEVDTAIIVGSFKDSILHFVKENTIETVGRIEAAYGKTRLAEPEKLEMFLELMDRHVDLAAIYAALDLK